MSGEVDLISVEVEQAPRTGGDSPDRQAARAESHGTRWRLALRPPSAAVVVVVALVASPIVVGALALVGESWVPMSDWASLVFRVSQVGTSDTPLVGPYSYHGFAHPGPLLYWVAAPLYRLTGGDPRSVLWTGALVNVLMVAWLAAVAWRRGRWPLLLGTMTLVALLVHGFGPRVMVDLWNPYVPLLPFLLAALLLWDAGLGRRQALVEAAVPATFAVQAHLAFLTLTGLVVLWLLAWVRWQPRLVPGPDETGGPDGDRDGGDGSDRVSRSAGDTTTTGRPPWPSLYRRLAVVLGLLWLGPLLDAVLDLHNPISIARALVSPESTVGPAGAPALVGFYVRVNGPWLGGGDPATFLEPPPLADVLHLLVLLSVVGVCLFGARRRRLVDAAALVTLSAVLLVGSIPAASQLVSPTNSYLTQWLKVVGGLAWFSVAWTGWRLAEPTVRARGPAVLSRRLGAPASRPRWVGAAVVALVGVTAWSWPDASRHTAPYNDGAPVVQEVRAVLQRELPRGPRYRVEVVGGPGTAVHYTGLIYWMIEDGFDVVSSDRGDGLKWGHAHRWSPGEPYDQLLTIAVSSGVTGSYERCQDDPHVEEVVAYDGLTPEERDWMVGVAWRLLDPAGITRREERRVAALAPRDIKIGVFEGPRLCGLPDTP